MKSPTIAVLAMAALIADSATAQRGGDQGGADAAFKLLLERHDKNEDGKIQKAEYARGEAQFARLDRNADGEITRADFAAGGRPGGQGRRGAGGGRSRQPMDREGMMRLVGQPLAQAANENDDKIVTREEWDRWLENIDAGDGITKSDLDQAGVTGRRAQMLMRMLDTDGERGLSIEEVAGMFVTLDVNQDGRIEGEELGRRPAVAPKVGVDAPDFDLPRVGAEGTVRLSGFKGDKPVALIFGSYT